MTAVGILEVFVLARRMSICHRRNAKQTFRKWNVGQTWVTHGEIPRTIPNCGIFIEVPLWLGFQLAKQTYHSRRGERFPLLLRCLVRWFLRLFFVAASQDVKVSECYRKTTFTVFVFFSSARDKRATHATRRQAGTNRRRLEEENQWKWWLPPHIIIVDVLRNSLSAVCSHGARLRRLGVRFENFRVSPRRTNCSKSLYEISAFFSCE